MKLPIVFPQRCSLLAFMTYHFSRNHLTVIGKYWSISGGNGDFLRSYIYLERLTRVLEMQWPPTLLKWPSGSCFMNLRNGVLVA